MRQLFVEKNLPVVCVPFMIWLTIILGHSGWDSIKKPYVWCEYNKGDSFVVDHQCKRLTNNRWKTLYLKSHNEWLNRDHWMQARATMGLGPYDEKAHKQWCNTYNSGISHFACVPSIYPIENIIFDAFHGQSGTFKVFVSFIRTLPNNTYQSLEDFSDFYLCLSIGITLL